MSNPQQEQDRRNKAYDLRLRGKSYREIGAELGVSHVTAMRWVNDYLSDVTLPLVDEVRKQEVDRMMKILDRLETRAEEGDDKAIALQLKVSERLCKMLGVDAPQQISVEKHEVTQLDLSIQELINSQHARNELRKQAAINLRSDEVSDVSDKMSADVESIVLEN